MDNAAADIRLAPGLHIVTQPDGSMLVEQSGERFDQVIAFKVTATAYANLRPFFETFPGAQTSTAMRWLLEQDTVREVIAGRLSASVVAVS